MKRILAATALAVAASTLVAAPAQAATSKSAYNCDGVTRGLTALEYISVYLSANCVTVRYDGDRGAAQAVAVTRPTTYKSSVTGLKMYYRPCSGGWTRVAFNPDTDGWWTNDPRDTAKTKFRPGRDHSQWYAAATFSAKIDGKVTTRTLRTPVAGRC